MDGFGNAESGPANAISAASTPNLTKLFAENPRSALFASGLDVGLPDGQMGNSEVGHTNIGAGRVVFQDLPRITRAIEDGSFFKNEELVAACKNCTDNGSALHLMGLMSDGGVHSHNTHVWGLLELAKRCGVEKVFIHCFLDGRDVSPTSGAAFVQECAEKCEEIGVGAIATVMGRYYAMDRDNRWERVEKAYRAIVSAEGEAMVSAPETVKKSYEGGKTDEFVEPAVMEGYKGVSENDSVIFFNYRPDRAREITRTFVDEAFDGFDRGDIDKNGKEDGEDVIALLRHLNNTEPLADTSMCDVNRDGKLNIQDVICLINHLNGTIPLETEPEPQPETPDTPAE